MSAEKLTKTIWDLLARSSRSSSQSPRRPRKARLELLRLEDRAVPATAASGTISGITFIDQRHFGVLDRGEILLPGTKVTLVGTTTTGVRVNSQVTTNATGRFTLKNVLPGNYRLVGRQFGILGSTTSLSGILHLTGGQTLRVNLGFRGLAASSVSVSQFLTNSTISNFPARAAGSGQTLVNFRANNLPELLTLLSDVTANKNDPNTIINLAANFTDPDLVNTKVRFITNQTGPGATGNGFIDVELFDKDAPQTVANFLAAIQAGKYDNSFFHRHETSGLEVIQGGGFNVTSNPTAAPDIDAFKDPLNPNNLTNDLTVPDEVSASRTNTINTISMAKTGSPNSATTEFFFNLKDNSSALSVPPQTNGGFTVFGRILTSNTGTTQTVNKIKGLSVQNTQQPALTQLPLAGSNVQKVTFGGTITGGTFTLSFKGQTTAPITFSSTTATLQTNIKNALAALSTVGGAANIDVAVDANGPIATVTFKGLFTGTVVPFMTANGTSLTGTIPTVNVVVGTAAPATPPDALPTGILTSDLAVIKDVQILGNAGKPDESLTYSVVSNSNTALVTTAIVNSRLVLHYTPGMTGTAVIKVMATDRFGATVPDEFTVTVDNHAPVISNVTFTPAQPGTNNQLKANVTASDPDGDTVTNSFVWKVNGNVIAGATTDTLDLSQAGNGDRGDVITVEVTPSDGSLPGTMFPATTTVGNTLPTVTSLQVDPTSVGTNGSLTATITAPPDADGDPVTYKYEWQVNGNTVQTTTNTNLTDTFDLSLANHGNKGDTITVKVTPNDGTNGLTTTSGNVNVVNSAPVIDTLDLTPSNPSPTSSVQAVTSTSDPDNDTVTLTFVWTINGTVVPNQTTDTLDLNGLGVNSGDEVAVTVTPNDGFLDGTSSTKSVFVGP